LHADNHDCFHIIHSGAECGTSILFFCPSHVCFCMIYFPHRIMLFLLHVVELK
jgi:hypothetical protein